MQAVLFDRNYWTESKAREWLSVHNHKPIKPVHITRNFLRYRLREPIDERYYTINLGNRIKAITSHSGRNGKGMNFTKILSLRPDHYARLLRPARRGGSLYSIMANNHDLINGVVGGIHTLASLAVLGGIGYAIKKKINN